MWPNNADGDVFRRLLESGFDFGKIVEVDCNVDFSAWPPEGQALELLHANYGKIHVVEPSGSFGGYVQFQIRGQLTYESVVSTQREVTQLMRPFGGICDSWGVIE